MTGRPSGRRLGARTLVLLVLGSCGGDGLSPPQGAPTHEAGTTRSDGGNRPPAPSNSGGTNGGGPPAADAGVSAAGGSAGSGGASPDAAVQRDGGTPTTPVGSGDVALFGILEQTFTSSGTAANPYKEVTATVTFKKPSGAMASIPMFWDGGTSWRVRVSPDEEGSWTWSTMSSDAGLGGKSGSFSVKAAGKRGGVMPMKGAPYHFQYQNGEPMWWMGDTEWTLFVDIAEKNHDQKTVFAYIDDRADAGFNVIHATAYRIEGNRAGTGFEDLTAERLNVKYWQEVDARLAYLNGAGITAGMNLAWGTDRWAVFPSDEARVRYARYFTARYAAYNVYFITAGEFDEAISPEQVRKIGGAIAEADPHDRMITIHSVGNVESFATDPWMSFGDYAQDRTDRHASILGARDHNKPVINAEHAYYRKDSGTNAVSDLDLIRLWHWEISMAGGYWFTGFGSTYRGGTRDGSHFNADPAESAWKVQATHIKKLFSKLQFWKLEPADRLITGAATVRYALAEPGRQYVAYVKGGAAVLQLMGSTAADNFTVERFDPRTGTPTAAGMAKGGGTANLMPPDAQDWVFVLQKVGP